MFQQFDLEEDEAEIEHSSGYHSRAESIQMTKRKEEQRRSRMSSSPEGKQSKMSRKTDTKNPIDTASYSEPMSSSNAGAGAPTSAGVKQLINPPSMA